MTPEEARALLVSEETTGRWHWDRFTCQDVADLLEHMDALRDGLVASHSEGACYCPDPAHCLADGQ